MENRYCVIMGGGIGSRFWPFSRNNRPKQFLDFFGIGRSLLQMSYDRFIKIIPKDHIFIVTNEIYVDLVKEQLPDIAEENILLEPTRRNTAPCIAWASYHIQALNPNANIVVAPSDHLILKEDEFAQCINRGLDFVSKYPALLTLGIKPNRPETGYGYIQIGEDAEDNIKTQSRICQNVCGERRIFLELRYFHLECTDNYQSVPTVFTRYFEPIRRKHQSIQHARRKTFYRRKFRSLPQYIDRFRYHGKSLERICALRRIRVERFRFLECPVRPLTQK